MTPETSKEKKHHFDTGATFRLMIQRRPNYTTNEAYAYIVH